MDHASDLSSRRSTSEASSDACDGLGALSGSERGYAYWDWKRSSYSGKNLAQTWIKSLPNPDDMVDPSTAIDGERVFTMPFMGLAEVEKTLYGREDPYAGCPWTEYPSRYEVEINRPLDLLMRFYKEVRWLNDQIRYRRGYPEPPLPAEEMIKRRWEQIFSSCLPAIENRELICQTASPSGNMPNVVGWK